MYCPYLLGRHYELYALRDLLELNLLGNEILPVIDPHELNATLIKVLQAFVNMQQRFALILNPQLGTFWNDYYSEPEGHADGCRAALDQLLPSSVMIKALLMNRSALDFFADAENGSSRHYPFIFRRDTKNVMQISTGTSDLDFANSFTANLDPQLALVPSFNLIRRRIHCLNKILLEDKFTKCSRNADYANSPDQFFSDDHLYYQEEGYIGWGDYSIAGRPEIVPGFAPRAVAIHLVYFNDANELYVRHFVSDSNDDIYNPAKKYHEALTKLKQWQESYQPERNPFWINTYAFQKFLEHYEGQKYSGLGHIKKLSIMHHIELMRNYILKKTRN